MKLDSRRLVGIIVPLTLLATLSLYAAGVWPEEHPSTTEVLECPEDYEGRLIGLRGVLRDVKISRGNLVLTLERYGRNFEVRYPQENVTEPESLENGDVIDLLGYSRLASEGYVEVTDLKHRPKERHEMMFLLSIAGLALVLAVLVKDRKRLLEVVFIA